MCSPLRFKSFDILLTVHRSKTLGIANLTHNRFIL